MEGEEEGEEEEEGGGADPPREVLARRQRRRAPGCPPGRARGRGDAGTAAGRERGGLRRPTRLAPPRRSVSADRALRQGWPGDSAEHLSPPEKLPPGCAAWSNASAGRRGCSSLSAALRAPLRAPPPAPRPFFSRSRLSLRLASSLLHFFPPRLSAKKKKINNNNDDAKRGGREGQKRKERKSQRKGANHAQYCLLRFIFLGRNFHLLSRAVSARLIAAIIPADK